MRATSYNKGHEAIFGIIIMIVTSLAALMILTLKLYFMI